MQSVGSDGTVYVRNSLSLDLDLQMLYVEHESTCVFNTLTIKTHKLTGGTNVKEELTIDFDTDEQVDYLIESLQKLKKEMA
jgi:hypothetical protein